MKNKHKVIITEMNACLDQLNSIANTTLKYNSPVSENLHLANIQVAVNDLRAKINSLHECDFND
jgi:hypothetical protein